MLASSTLGQWKHIVGEQYLLERFALSSSKSSWDVCYSRAQPLPTWDRAVPNQRTFNTEINILSCLYWGAEELCNWFQWNWLLQLIQGSSYCKHCNRIFYITKPSKFFLHYNIEIKNNNFLPRLYWRIFHSRYTHRFPCFLQYFWRGLCRSLFLKFTCHKTW